MNEATIRFETHWGTVSLSYVEQGITRLSLPDPLLEPSSPVAVRPLPPGIALAVDKMKAHFEGSVQWFDDLPVASTLGDGFSSRVYRTLRLTPPGELTTYGALARRASHPGAARAVAGAMARNPVPLIVPCHRVVGGNGALGGFSAQGGTGMKCRLLALEGVVAPVLPLERPFASLFEPQAFDLSVRMLQAREPLFARLTKQGPLPPLHRAFPGNPFGALAEAVCYQQLAGTAAQAIFDRLVLSMATMTPEALLRLTDEELTATGLSGTKRATLRELARRFLDGRLTSLELSGDETRRRALLLAIPGIGPWTVQMFEIFHLGLPDIAAPADLGVRKGLGRLLGLPDLPTADQTARVMASFRPFQTLATWGLWRSLGGTLMGQTE